MQVLNLIKRFLKLIFSLQSKRLTQLFDFDVLIIIKYIF